MCGFASLLCVGVFLTTLTFLFTPPGWEPTLGGFPALSAPVGQFLLKDIGSPVLRSLPRAKRLLQFQRQRCEANRRCAHLKISIPILGADHSKNSVFLMLLNPPVVNLSQYVFEPLQKGEDFIIYRGHRNDASQVLALSPGKEPPGNKGLKRIKQEFSQPDSDSEWAIRSIGIAHLWDRRVLVLEDPAGMPLDQLLGGPLGGSVCLACGR